MVGLDRSSSPRRSVSSAIGMSRAPGRCPLSYSPGCRTSTRLHDSALPSRRTVRTSSTVQQETGLKSSDNPKTSPPFLRFRSLLRRFAGFSGHLEFSHESPVEVILRPEGKKQCPPLPEAVWGHIIPARGGSWSPSARPPPGGVRKGPIRPHHVPAGYPPSHVYETGGSPVESRESVG